MKYNRFISLIILVFASYLNVSAQEERADYWSDLADRYFTRHEKLTNFNFVNFSYGPSSLSLFKTDDFSPAYVSEFKYGFIRFDNELGVDSIFETSSEYAFLGNTSSKFKLSPGDPKGIIVDAWYFGLAKKSGIGINFKALELTPYHGAALLWNRCDFQNFSPDSLSSTVQKNYDEQFRFGTAWTAGVDLKVNSFMSFNMEYSNHLYFSSFSAGKFAGDILFDNLFQAIPEFFEPELIKKYGKYYPYFKFVYKNGISYFLYQTRKTTSYFPFKSDRSFFMEKFSLGLNFIF